MTDPAPRRRPPRLHPPRMGPHEETLVERLRRNLGVPDGMSLNEWRHRPWACLDDTRLVQLWRYLMRDRLLFCSDDVRRWWTFPVGPYLEGRSPAEAWDQGDRCDVVALVEAWEDGVVL